MNKNLWVGLENAKSESPVSVDDLHPSELDIACSSENDPVLTAIFSCLGVDETFLSRSDAPTPCNRDIETRPWILHVDDDLELSNAIKMRLELYGVSVAQARNGLGGVRQAFTTPASAILLDYEMPHGNGRFVLQKLKACEHTRNIPVIILTGHRDPGLKQELLALGATGFLSKPVKLEMLLTTLRKYVELGAPRGAASLLT